MKKNLVTILRDGVNGYFYDTYTDTFKSRYLDYMRFVKISPPEFKYVIQSADLLFRLSIVMAQISESNDKKLVETWDKLIKDNNYKIKYIGPGECVEENNQYVENILGAILNCCEDLSKGNNKEPCRGCNTPKNMILYYSKKTLPPVQFLISWYNSLLSENPNPALLSKAEQNSIFLYNINNI